VRLIAAVLLVSATMLCGCGGGSSNTSQAPANATPVATSATATPSDSTRLHGRGTVVKTARSQFGDVLYDGAGQAIYIFDKEHSSKPECYGACAEAWPPVLSTGAPVAAAGARSAALGTTKRIDGSTQVTYAGHPLYYYAHEGRNEVRCHNVREFGGLWLAVTATGAPAPH
jgi:predicted lipoprotein with Yx(FWY)xxD motif